MTMVLGDDHFAIERLGCWICGQCDEAAGTKA